MQAKQHRHYFPCHYKVAELYYPYLDPKAEKWTKEWMNEWISRGCNSALDIPHSVFPTAMFSFKKEKKKAPLILKYNESLIK